MNFKRFWTIAFAVTIAVIVAALAAFAGYTYEQQNPGTVTVIPVGEISVSPSSLAFGEVHRGDEVVREITVTNTSDGPLDITADFTVDGELLGYGTSFTLCESVEWSGISVTLPKSGDPGDSVTGNVTFRISPDALAGESTFNWSVYGKTPTD
jgi:hypothetical protein